MLKTLVLGAKRRRKVKRVLGEGGYDSKENFEFLEGKGIEAGIKVRKGSNPNCRGKRGRVVKESFKDPPSWEGKVGYGKRWIKETFFSSFN